MTKKERILELRQQNKSYNEIVDILGCSKSIVCYYCDVSQKNKYLNRQRINRSKKHPFQSKYNCFIYTKKRQNNLKKQISNKLERILYKRLHNFNGRKTMPNFTVQDVIEKYNQNPKCYLTGQEIDINDTNSYEFDHIIPKSRGGQNTLDNLGICSRQANQAKRDMTPDEFINLCKIVAQHNS